MIIEKYFFGNALFIFNQRYVIIDFLDCNLKKVYKEMRSLLVSFIYSYIKNIYKHILKHILKKNIYKHILKK